MVMVAAKLESAREGDGLESSEKEQEEWDGTGDDETLRPKQKRKMSKSKHVVTLTFFYM